MTISINTTNFPVISIVFPEETPDENELDLFFNQFLDMASEENPITVIFFIDRVNNVPIRYRKKVIDFHKQLLLKGNCLNKCIIVLKSKVIKNFIRCILNVVKPISVTFILNKNNTDMETDIKNILITNHSELSKNVVIFKKK